MEIYENKIEELEEIKIGEYIRTELGDIKQITEGFEFIIEIHNKSSNKIVKHSKNIIDLIEVGDIVTIEEIDTEWKRTVEVDEEEYIKYLKMYVGKEEKLISILTHEQYEQNSYKIGE